MEGLREAKILDFHVFFDVFSTSFFKRASEEQKIAQHEPTRRRRQFFGVGLRCTGGSWGKERIGVRTLQIEMRERMSRLASCDSTETKKSISHAVGTPTVAGGLKTPRGEHRRPPTLGVWQFGEAAS